ncbi:MAG: ISNCY family transposase [Nitrospirae bacterium]|nr:ISNCY family transposase [Nitrospirota bacterium]
MGRKDIIIMTQEELRRASIVHQAIRRMITQEEAAEVIGISERHTRRLIKRVREEGDRGIIHGSRGKPGHARIDEEIRAKAIEICEEKYKDFGPTFASEKLCELNKIKVHHDTLRRWLIDTDKDKWEWQRKARPHRQWRQRKDYFGEMVQVDGSHHDWLEGRGPWLIFMGYIDDATGITFGRFYDYEGTMPAMDSLMRYIGKYGIPQSIYIDGHRTYKSTRKQTIEEQLRNEMPLTQFGRAAKELGIIVIHAHSAPAKGRIERGFGTHQDRLIKEMRLAGIKSKDEANEFLGTYYLPKHNKKFSISPAKEANLHRKPPGKKELKKILCMRTKRYLGNDAVIRHDNKFYQIEDIPRRRMKTVMVEDRLDGSMHVRNNGSYFKYREIEPRLITKAPAAQKQAARPKRVYIPPKDHPWRCRKIKTYPYTNNYLQKERNTKEEKEL